MSAVTQSSLALYPKFKAFSPSTGLPLAGGTLQTFAAGTSTLQATYADATLLSPNSNPILLDANGEALIYTPKLLYKFVLKDAVGNTIWTVDNYAPGGSTAQSIVQAKLAADSVGPYAAKTQVTNFAELVDTNNEFNAGVFTAANGGYYDISFNVVAKDTGAAGQNMLPFININGVDAFVGFMSTVVSNTACRVVATLNAQPLNAGDIVRFYYQGTVNTTLYATGVFGSTQTYVSIVRVG